MTVPDEPLIATGSQTVGPFFHVGPGATDALGRMAAPGVAGDRIRLRVRVLDADAAPVPDALIELWQADAAGRYSAPFSPGTPPPAFSGFGRLGTNADGWCAFETIRPGAADTSQAAHVNVCLHARGLLRHLYTRVYFAGDPDLGLDRVLAAVQADRRETLLARPSDANGTWEFTIRLQGGDETVFFDL